MNHFKIILFTLVFCLISPHLLAQLQGESLLDSLLNELPKAKDGKDKVILLSTISKELYTSNPDKGIEYGKEGVSLAKSLNWKKGLADNYLSLGLNYSFGKSDNTKADEYFQKALKIYREIGDEKGEAGILSKISFQYYSTNPDEGIKIGLQGVKIAEESDNKEEMAHNYVSLGVNYAYGKSNFPKSIEYFNIALKTYEEIEDKSKVASTLGYFGFIYRNQSDYAKALDYYQRSLKIYEQLGNKTGVAANLGNIGMIYDFKSDFPRALEYYRKALVIKEELGSKDGQAALLANIGLVYYFQSDFPNALENFQKSATLFEEAGNLNGLASSVGNTGLIYQKQGDYSRALENYNKAVDIYEELGSRTNLANNLGNIGELYFTLSQDSILKNIKTETKFVSLKKNVNLGRSIEYYKRAIDLLEEIGELHTRSSFLKGLSDAYKERGNLDSALSTYKAYNILEDSVFSEKSNTAIANLEAIRQNDLKDREIKIKDLKITQSKNERWALIGGAIAVSIVAFVIFRQRRKSEQLLLNILPMKIAKRLKKKERLIADDIECASIVFIDLVGFTAYSKDRQASEVLQMLNTVFEKIDSLIVKYGLEKIKTIGDGYMAAAGVPEPCDDHAARATNFSLDVHIVIDKVNREKDLGITARVGIESGPIVAGVIGDMKFAYDLWGDSVNTASRMESTGTPGLVHISANVKRELDRTTDQFRFEELPPMVVKGKGEMLTYMVHRK